MMIAIKLRLDQIDKSKIRQSDGCDDDDFCDCTGTQLLSEDEASGLFAVVS